MNRLLAMLVLLSQLWLPVHADPPASAAAIPYKQEIAADTLLLKLTGGLLLAGLASVGIALAVRRFLPGLARAKPDTDKLQLTERLRLSASSQLFVVMHRNEELLLVESSHGVQLLSKKALASPENRPDA